MNDYTKCPNCTKEGLTVPMSKEGKDWVCSLCGTIEQSDL